MSEEQKVSATYLIIKNSEVFYLDKDEVTIGRSPTNDFLAPDLRVSRGHAKISKVNDKYLQLNGDYVLFPQKKIKEICSRYGIPFLDLTAAIYKNGGTKLFADYLHLNSRGNDVVAREITRYLSSELTADILAPDA